MQQVASGLVAPRRLATTLLGVFSAVALILAAIGLYGVMSTTAGERTHEIGVRMALGGSRVGVIWLMLRQAMILVLVGSVIGLFGAFSAARVASSLLFRVKLADPPTIVGATLLLFAAALLACYMPASTASKVDPMTALRYE